MSTNDPILVAKGDTDNVIILNKGNRHGLITGATGTGKTVTLQTIAEQFSKRGVPVFMADVKGDLSGMSQPGGNNPKIADRVKQLGMQAVFKPAAVPVTFWDVFGEQGHPLRATVSEMGPILLGRMLQLNDVQEGVLNIAFKYADDQGLLLLDLKDLRAMMQYVAENSQSLMTEYGSVSTASVGAIQRALLQLEQQGGDKFFGEPALDLADLIQTESGQGVVNILAADKLMQNPQMYATFLLWLLSELWTKLPEIGDPDRPKLVFFFDEAHLLFDDAPSNLLDKVQQVVRLIRSKGVGVYFVTQNPTDVPDSVLGQLGNRVQHALRAFTPRDQRAVKSAADTFRQNPKINIEEVITQLNVGEALVSFLDDSGAPTIVQRAWVVPPMSQVGAISPQQRASVIQNSIVASHYEQAIDRESAYEVLKSRHTVQVAQPASAQTQIQTQPSQQPRVQQAPARTQPPAAPVGPSIDTSAILTGIGAAAGIVGKSLLRGVGSSLGRQLTRSILGGLLGGSTTSRRSNSGW